MKYDAETHDKHHDFIDALLEKEKQRSAFRQAVIEKTLASLVWSFIVGVGYTIVSQLKLFISNVK